MPDIEVRVSHRKNRTGGGGPILGQGFASGNQDGIISLIDTTVVENV